MPFKNNRNSRDDKSKKNTSPTKRTRINSDRPYKTNTNNEEKFGDHGNDFKKDPKKSDVSNYYSTDKSDNKTTSRSTGQQSAFGKKPFTKPGADPRENAGRSSRETWNKSEGSNSNQKRIPDSSRTKKAFGESGNSFKKEGENRGGFRKPFNRDDKSGKPADRYRKDDRKWSSEERVSSGNRAKKTISKVDDGLIRLNRYIANAGICSRRKADELIGAGVVSVNGQAISELGFKVDPFKDEVRYNGQLLKREKMVYVLLNKPKDYITTTDDPQERRTVMQLVEKASRERIYPVGRLDRNTTGLLLMTNDGDLADKLSHPRNNITKIYQAELNKNLTQGDLNKIAFGLELEDGLIKPDEVTYVQGGSKREIGIQIHSGKNRIVRRIFEHLGYDVIKLDRVIYANLTKKDLPKGRWRYLEEKEVIQLKHLMQ
ncbi:MAG TPA: pseudouridine synthase [Sphingobacteriaceae bacterium]|nr:pseudouridine synthase [Sphingobacteriaceae bacterium]